MIDNDLLAEKFTQLFGAKPTLIARAPGRINLIGEHTDYNGGFVLPAAIEYEIKMAARRTDDGSTRLHSLNYNDSYSYAAGELPPPGDTQWYSYWLAVCAQFRQRGFIPPGLEIAINGDVPLGAGLSSSAAFEVCGAILLNHVCDAGMSPKEIALLAQAAEHSAYVGVRCGIMDQFASALGADAGALFLDCYTLDYQTVPFDPAGATIVIINSNKARELRTSEFNRRREECEEGLRLICDRAKSDYPTLRHVPYDIFERYADQLPGKIRDRVKHNLQENERVKQFVTALEAADWARAGELLYESHASLRDDYEVSCDELDAIVEIARKSGLAHGCRMTGGGFGGCAVALVPPDNVGAFIDQMTANYRDRTGTDATIYTSKPVAGANVLPL